MARDSRTIPNLAQGVTQQSPRDAWDSQCASQYDCINSLVEGATARPGFDWKSVLIPNQTFKDAFFWPIYRSETEQYLVIIKSGVLRVFNILTGVECTVNESNNPGTYLTLASGTGRDNFAACSVNDTTFISNKQKITAMDTGSLSADTQNQAMFHVRAGNYLATYQIGLIYNGKIYVWKYETPDNSDPKNAKYVQTSVIAAALYKAMAKKTPKTRSWRAGGETIGADESGVGPSYNMHKDPGSRKGDLDVNDLGFKIDVSGNYIRLWRDDANDFDIDVADSLGGNAIIGIKGTVQSFTDLPRVAPNGYKVKIRGSSNVEEDDYWVEFRARDIDTGPGTWVECIAPNTYEDLDFTTMPYRLVNTAADTFDLKKVNWVTRTAGDGVNSVVDPSFLGKPIKDLCFAHDRLGLMHDGGIVWSKNKQPYTLFAPSAQIVLATDPIDQEVNDRRQIALLDRVVQAAEAEHLWAEGVQSRVTFEQKFAPELVGTKPTTAFTFLLGADVEPLGTAVYFAAKSGEWARLWELTQAPNGTLRQRFDTTQHVQKFLDVGLRDISGSDDDTTLFLTSVDVRDTIYIYNWLVAGDQRKQAAWNTWRLPSDCETSWIGVHRSKVYLVVQKNEGLCLLTMDLSFGARDPDQTDYLTRLDLRVSEADLSPSYSAGSDETTLTLPYTATGATTSNFAVAIRTDDANNLRGDGIDLVSVNGSTVVVPGDLSAAEFYAGFVVSSERTELEFNERWDDKKGQGSHTITERLQVDRFELIVRDTGYTRVEVTPANGNITPTSEEYRGLPYGYSGNVQGVHLGTGRIASGVGFNNDEVTIRLVNDSHLPSAWTAAKVVYSKVQRTKEITR